MHEMSMNSKKIIFSHLQVLQQWQFYEEALIDELNEKISSEKH
jgi:hypothetical protein